MIDLYADLDIRPAASPREVHLAYRKAAKRHHPDAGGDREAFDKISFAYEVLSDPDRRAKYDATGSADPSTPDNSISALISTLSSLFASAIGSAMKSGTHPSTIDMVGLMIAEAGDAKTRANTAISQNQTNLQTLRPLQDTFETIDPDAPNHLETMLRGQISGIERAIEQVQAQIKQIEAAALYLSGCRYRKKSPAFFGAPLNIRVTIS